jgi:hypothetical protein
VNGTFEPPHPNGAAHRNEQASRRRRRRRNIILGAVVVVAMAWGYAFWFSVTRNTSPELLDDADRAAVIGACDRARAQLETIETEPIGETAPTRVREENEILTAMVREFDALSPADNDPRAALDGWTNDWTDLIAAREAFAADLADDGSARAPSVPNVKENSLKPITVRMTEYAEQQDMPTCTVTALQADVVDRERDYTVTTEE